MSTACSFHSDIYQGGVLRRGVCFSTKSLNLVSLLVPSCLEVHYVASQLVSEASLRLRTQSRCPWPCPSHLLFFLCRRLAVLRTLLAYRSLCRRLLLSSHARSVPVQPVRAIVASDILVLSFALAMWGVEWYVLVPLAFVGLAPLCVGICFSHTGHSGFVGGFPSHVRWAVILML